jgi:hypothetical protein
LEGLNEVTVNKYHRNRSQLQERRVAADLGGHVQAASGAMPHAKGDVRVNGEVRVECKTTTQPTFILQRATVQKIKAESISQGLEDWVIQLEFKTQGSKVQFAIMDVHRANEMGLGAHLQDGIGVIYTDKQSMTLDRQYLQEHQETFVGFVTDIGPIQMVVLPWSRYLELRETK